jgi:hypothetical protein
MIHMGANFELRDGLRFSVSGFDAEGVLGTLLPSNVKDAKNRGRCWVPYEFFLNNNGASVVETQGESLSHSRTKRSREDSNMDGGDPPSKRARFDSANSGVIDMES